MFRRNRERLTQRLSGSAYSLTILEGRRATPWLLVILLVALCAGAYVLFKVPSPTAQLSAEVARLQGEVTHLQQEAKFGEMRLQQEVATREGLAKQMDAQSQKLRQAEQEVEFFRGQKNMAVRDKLPVRK
ncbi:MAG: hypothetical protein JWN23_1960 [Rhodocyclales bacterium]|nr:hypothetical protein [Rhodocyclales bacterium]